jgi:O-antigen/teichoic acid export membrane protein
MSSSSTTAERTTADRFMRRLLRVGDVVDKNAILGARRNTTAAIVVSGIRCIITYLLIPILAPIVGLTGAASAPITIALSVLAIYMGISGVRRFWIADHRARWAYTTFIGVVVVLLLIGIVVDVRTIVSA